MLGDSPKGDPAVYDKEARNHEAINTQTLSVSQKQLPFYAMLMDSWYASKELMLFIDSLSKIYSCPLKANRQVDDSAGQRPYGRVDALVWSADELAYGKQIKIKGFPDYRVACAGRLSSCTAKANKPRGWPAG